MSGGYDDRDGKIWLDGNFVDWRDANVHVLTHAMHYASSVFEGERAYNGKIFKSVKHSERFKKSANLIDFEIPYTVEEIEKAKYQALEKTASRMLTLGLLLGAAQARIWEWLHRETRFELLWRFGPGEITTVTRNLKEPN